MILVTGATGFIGRHLVKRLLDEGRRVRCLVPEYRLRHIPWQKSSPQPEIVVGNVLNEEALFRAVTGIHAIIHLENAFWWGRPRQLERIELVGTRQLVTAARAARVGRLLTVSHLGASPSSGYTLMRVKGQVEEGLRASGIAYTIIRSGIVFGEQDSFVNHIAMMMRTNPFFFLMPGRGEVVLHPIFIDDLARAVARSLELVDTVDRVIEIGGPEYITLEDLVRTVMRVTGTPRVVIPAPPYLLRWVSSLYSRVLPRSLMTPQWFDVLGANRTTKLGNAFSDFGIHPRRFEDTLLTYMPGRSYWWPALRYATRRRPRGI